MTATPRPDGGVASGRAPVAVEGLSGVAAISAGGDFSLALLTKGTVESWGSDELGQLDNSASEGGGSNVPVPAEGLTGVAAVAAGAGHSLALLSTGSVMAWGADSAGELGNGVIKTSQEAPVPVSGLSGVTAISAGGTAPRCSAPARSWPGAATRGGRWATASAAAPATCP